MLIFVFGTLKEGFPNSGINGGARVSGVFLTHERYPLYLVGERHSPWLLDAPGRGEYVSGQVFDVGPEALTRMDLLERVGQPDGYERVQIQVKTRSGDAGALILASAYLKPQGSLDGAKIMAGPLAEYTLEHAARYRERAVQAPGGPGQAR